MSMLRRTFENKTFENHDDTRKDTTDDDAVKLNLHKAKKDEVRYKEIVKERKFL